MEIRNGNESDCARIQYKLHHLDMFSDFYGAWSLVRNANVLLTPADVSPEFAAFIRGMRIDPYEIDHRPEHWSEQQ